MPLDHSQLGSENKNTDPALSRLVRHTAGVGSVAPMAAVRVHRTGVSLGKLRACVSETGAVDSLWQIPKTALVAGCLRNRPDRLLFPVYYS